MEFTAFGKIPRLSRECVITEKIDGTNASIFIHDSAVDLSVHDLNPALSVAQIPMTGFAESIGEYSYTRYLFAGSRTRWITPQNDNYGFAKWVVANASELAQLGPGHHFGEWWGGGIQRGYGLQKGEKRFSLFNTSRWNAENVPQCCSVVPVLYSGLFTTLAVDGVIDYLRTNGSQVAPGFMKPEGVVIYHVAANTLFKKTLEKDEAPKGAEAA